MLTGATDPTVATDAKPGNAPPVPGKGRVVLINAGQFDPAAQVGQRVEARGLLYRDDRETLVAFYVDGRSLLEMSDDFDAPVGTIKRRLHVARKRLAKEVEELVAV